MPVAPLPAMLLLPSHSPYLEMSNAGQFTFRTLDAINSLPAEAWNACAHGSDAILPRHPDNPFLSHAFLHALEASGSAVASRGWQPMHLVLEDPAGQPLGVVPVYMKSHSQGEYIFDHAWADAFQRAGGHYYPKLLAGIPFTPATGPRILARGGYGLSADRVRDLLVQGLLKLCEHSGTSSVHINFPTETEYHRLGELGLLQRMDQQFHWLNRGYQGFDEFLMTLTSSKRKNLKRERREALASGVQIDWVTGSDLCERHWDAFYDFYLDTGSRKWGRPYLTRDFFSLIGESMADKVLLILCRRAGRYIAGALNFIGEQTLFGRHWGCIEDHRFLHFEACYYQAIDFAISHGLQRVEAGAQGYHKVARGYLPCATYSAHWIAHPGLREAVSAYLERERGWVREDIRQAETHTPFSSHIDLAEIRALDSKGTRQA